MQKKRLEIEIFTLLLCITATFLLGSCGGGGGSGSGSSGGIISPNGTSDSQRTEAATETAQNNASCTAVQPFYWEIGDRDGALAFGTVGGSSPTSTTTMLIASASKWMFGAYLIELRNGALSSNDIAALTMQTGYTNLRYDICLNSETVNECFTATHSAGANNDFDSTAVNNFYYNGGHFQKYAAVDLSLSNSNNASLETTIASRLGTDLAFTYDSPQLAAGVSTTAADYATFLQKILSSQLRMHDFLGTNTVCTNPSSCSSALSTPVPSTETWHYSLAHWVEDDSTVGDGAFSSPGAFGFYPWIDADKTYYGILARSITPTSTDDSVAMDSVYCGRLIRKAWLEGEEQ